MVIREQWPQLDDWFATHATIQCSSTFYPESFSATSFPPMEKIWLGSYSLYGRCITSDNQSHVYSMDFAQITIEKFHGEWKVTEWQGIQETLE